jgi:hypothetical protein
MLVQFNDAARFEISFTARKPDVSGEGADFANVEWRLGHGGSLYRTNELLGSSDA